MMGPTRKKFLFVMQRAPHGSCYAQEALDLLLTTAAFEQAVSVLLLDDGVFLIKKGQQPDRIDSKDIAPVFLSLEIYEVHRVFVEQESLQERGLKPNDLLLPVETIPRCRVGTLIARHDRVVNG
jgi:tRNA 2-thiouridine synthesizing protein C